MNKLQELYAKRKVFEEYNMEVPEELSNEIMDLERNQLDSINDIILGYMPEEIDVPIDGRVVLAAEYIDGKLTMVGASTRFDIAGNFDKPRAVFAESYEDDTDIVSVNEEDDDGNITEEGRKKSKSIGFTVKFGDGKVVKHKTARRTMIETLKYMGLERASKYQGETFKGYPLVGKNKRLTDQKHLWQVQVDGWWIYVNMGNSRAIACIKGVADMLNIPLEIIRDDELAVLPLIERESKEIGDAKGKRAKYSLNGGMPTWKNRTVLNTVGNLLKELPNATFRDICEFFPKSLQGSYGVVATISDIEERCKQNKSENRRWFLDPSDILTLADGTKFTVTTEWGDNFENFRKHVIREFGWTIEEVK